MLVVGNKCDLEEERETTRQEAENFCSDEGFYYIETSALKNANVQEAFNRLIEEMHRKTMSELINGERAKKAGPGNTIKLKRSNTGRRKKAKADGCC